VAPLATRGSWHGAQREHWCLDSRALGNIERSLSALGAHPRQPPAAHPTTGWDSREVSLRLLASDAAQEQSFAAQRRILPAP
jgi:hypothetical protein